jgi:hypothetical protein
MDERSDITETDANDKELLLATALASGKTWRAAATAAGVGVTTVTRRMREPAFRALVCQLRRASIERAAATLAEALTDAATQLALIASNGEEESNRLKASIALLQIGLKYHQDTDMAERIAALESAMGNNVPTIPPTEEPHGESE